MYFQRNNNNTEIIYNSYDASSVVTQCDCKQLLIAKLENALTLQLYFQSWGCIGQLSDPTRAVSEGYIRAKNSQSPSPRKPLPAHRLKLPVDILEI